VSATSDRIDQLERELADVRAMLQPIPRGKRRWRVPRVLLIGLVLALAIPVGVLAAQRYSDVPTSNKFYNDIEAIAAVGITSGCTATRYCPDGLVTRGQMAAFLNRLGALGPGKTPKVNADRLDGLDSSAFTRAAYATVRPDQCFLDPGNHCSLSNARNIGHVRKVTTGIYCVAPAAGSSFAGRTAALSITSANLAAGVPILIADNPGFCDAGEIEVQAWNWTAALTYTLSDFVGFGIVIP
jgi:hypothetical protein